MSYSKERISALACSARPLSNNSAQIDLCCGVCGKKVLGAVLWAPARWRFLRFLNFLIGYPRFYLVGFKMICPFCAAGQKPRIRGQGYTGIIIDEAGNSPISALTGKPPKTGEGK